MSECNVRVSFVEVANRIRRNKGSCPSLARARDEARRVKNLLGEKTRFTACNFICSAVLYCPARGIFREIFDLRPDFHPHRGESSCTVCRGLNSRVSSARCCRSRCRACAASFATLPLTTTLLGDVVLRGQICHLKITAPLATCTNKRLLRTVIR